MLNNTRRGDVIFSIESMEKGKSQRRCGSIDFQRYLNIICCQKRNYQSETLSIQRIIILWNLMAIVLAIFCNNIGFNIFPFYVMNKENSCISKYLHWDQIDSFLKLSITVALSSSILLIISIIYIVACIKYLKYRITNRLIIMIYVGAITFHATSTILLFIASIGLHNSTLKLETNCDQDPSNNIMWKIHQNQHVISQINALFHGMNISLIVMVIILFCCIIVHNYPWQRSAKTP